MRTLVVDDSRTVRAILRQILEELGSEVVEAENGRNALAWLADGNRADLCLVDWTMPEMDGIELLRAIKEIPSLCDVRLVMVTKQTKLENVMEAIAAGAHEYITKPFTAETVREKLGTLGLPV